jgi:spermidine synthase
MSDTDAELRDLSAIAYSATGHVLLNGLGLGVVLQACLAKSEVTKVTVIEVDADVIELVARHYEDPRVKIIHADALTYRPPKGTRYGAVWHDIWDGSCSDNLEQMKLLHRRYGRLTDWQGSWGRHLIRR